MPSLWQEPAFKFKCVYCTLCYESRNFVLAQLQILGLVYWLEAEGKGPVQQSSDL